MGHATAHRATTRVDDVFDYLDRAGYKAMLREDGNYDVRNVGILAPPDVFNLWLNLKCWPLPLGLPPIRPIEPDVTSR